MAQAERSEDEDGGVIRHEMAEQFGEPVQRAELAGDECGEDEPGESGEAAGEVVFHGVWRKDGISA